MKFTMRVKTEGRKTMKPLKSLEFSDKEDYRMRLMRTSMDIWT